MRTKKLPIVLGKCNMQNFSNLQTIDLDIAEDIKILPIVECHICLRIISIYFWSPYPVNKSQYSVQITESTTRECKRIHAIPSNYPLLFRCESNMPQIYPAIKIYDLFLYIVCMLSKHVNIFIPHPRGNSYAAWRFASEGVSKLRNTSSWVQGSAQVWHHVWFILHLNVIKNPKQHDDFHDARFLCLIYLTLNVQDIFMSELYWTN